MMDRKCSAALLALVWMALARPADANDIFIGTLSIEGEHIVLKRCDLVQNTYVLGDAEGLSAVAAMRKRAPAAKGYWYAEVIGEYTEIEGGDGLSVTSIKNIEADRSCHLLDVIGNDEIQKGSARSHRDD